jgi:ankyrin repeat protein
LQIPVEVLMKATVAFALLSVAAFAFRPVTQAAAPVDDAELHAFQQMVFNNEIENVRAALAKNRQLASAVEPVFNGTALHRAAGPGHLELVRLLLENGANPNARDKNGQTPLHMARTGAIVEILLRYHADITLRANDGMTVLHWACVAQIPGEGAVQTFLSRGADIEARDQRGWTPLHWAAFSGATPTMTVLTSHRAQVNARANDGATPLYEAASQGHLDAVQLLLANGADPNARDNTGDTPLSIAIEHARNITFDSPLMTEVKQRFGEIARRLRAAGARG